MPVTRKKNCVFTLHPSPGKEKKERTVAITQVGTILNRAVTILATFQSSQCPMLALCKLFFFTFFSKHLNTVELLLRAHY